MSRKKARAKYQLIVTCPIRLLTQSGDSPTGPLFTRAGGPPPGVRADVPTPEDLRKLHGRTFDNDEDQFDQYMESCGLYKRGKDGELLENGEVTGGRLHFEYRASKKQLWAVVEFEAPRKLNAEEKEEFLDEIRYHNIWGSLVQQHDLMYMDVGREKFTMKQVKLS